MFGSLSPTIPAAVRNQDVQKHSTHYSGARIVLQVEGTLFRVEKSLLCRFDVFRDMFEGAGSHVKDTDEGLADEKPIVLQGVTSFEVESLLLVMEARWLEGIPLVSAEEWKAVLHLSTMWENENLRQFATDKIDGLKLPPIELLGLATKCRVEKWLKPASVELCLRATSLSFQEGVILGFHFFAELCKIREGCMTISSTGSTCRNCNKIYSGSCTTCALPYNRNYNSYNYSSYLCNCGVNRSSNLQKLRESKAQSSVDSLLATGIRPLPGVTKNIKKFDGSLAKRHHPIFYLGVDVTYQVEQTLFRSHKATLLQFQVLRPVLDKHGSEENESARLSFNDVTEFEMTTTLDILNARWFEGDPSFTFEQWKAILQVATLWGFGELRQLAISKIEDSKPTPMVSILLARKCNVSQWLLTGYIDLCMRPQSISAEEGILLGIELFASLIRIRESKKGKHCPGCNNWTISLTCGSCFEATRWTVKAAVSKLLPGLPQPDVAVPEPSSLSVPNISYSTANQYYISSYDSDSDSD